MASLDFAGGLIFSHSVCAIRLLRLSTNVLHLLSLYNCDFARACGTINFEIVFFTAVIRLRYLQVKMRRGDERLRDSRNSRDSREYIDEYRSRDLERKRREWRIEQEKRREHEKRKQKMIEEFEVKRAKELELKKQRRRSQSRSRSASPGPSRHQRSKSTDDLKSRSTGARVSVMSEKCDTSSTNNTPLFKGSEGLNININELKKIKVNIERDIPNGEDTTELLRDIKSIDDIVLKRREGEGAKPIFEREELQPKTSCANHRAERRTIIIDQVEPGEGSKPIFEREELKIENNATVDVRERRTVVAVEDMKKRERRSSERRSRSLSSGRRDSHRKSRHDSTSRYTQSRHSRADSYDRDRPSSASYHERRSTYSRRSSQERSRESRSRRSLDRDRAVRTEGHRDPRYSDERDYEARLYTGRGEVARRSAPLPYAEPMPIPVYYDNLGRPMMMDPMMMMRPAVPAVPELRGRGPHMIPTFRPPYRPRFMPPAMFRPNIPSNQRYGRMF